MAGRLAAGCGRTIVLGLLSFSLALCFFAEQAASTSEFRIRLSRFENNEGQDADGHCCSGQRLNVSSISSSSSSSSSLSSSSSPAGLCSETCRTFFRICLANFMHNIPVDPPPPCAFGSFETPVIGDNTFGFREFIQAAAAAVNASDDGSSSAAAAVGASGTRQQDYNNPVIIPLKLTWPGSFTIIIEAFHDVGRLGPTKGSPRRLIWRHASNHLLLAGTDWQRPSDSSSSSSPAGSQQQQQQRRGLDFAYRVVCTGDYYGPWCNVTCKSRDDLFGHNTCDVNGTRVCYSGWSGSYCTEPTCDPTCQNGGRCSEPNVCRCIDGWRGPQCDLCRADCVHGTCQQPHQCICQEGWGGENCDQDLNYCTTHRPCQSGATCINSGPGSYTCVCERGFTGTNCELRLVDCANEPCYNGGTCLALVDAKESGSSGRCRCTAGWTGPRCESRATFDSCEGRPCLNRGICAPLPTDSSTYRCWCQAGFEGVNCETVVDLCRSSPCRNGGSCVNEAGRFRCTCPDGFTGIVCIARLPVSPTVSASTTSCQQRPCSNGGTCLEVPSTPGGRSGGGSFECRCPPGFGGQRCADQLIGGCVSNPCQNGATCIGFQSADDYLCLCEDGFAGTDCEQSELHQNNSGETWPPPVRRGEITDVDDRKSNWSATVLQLALFISVGVVVPLLAIVVTALVVLFVRRRRRLKRLQQQRQRSAIFIKNDDSSAPSGVARAGGLPAAANNRDAAVRQNRLNSAVALATASSMTSLNDASRKNRNKCGGGKGCSVAAVELSDAEAGFCGDGGGGGGCGAVDKFVGGGRAGNNAGCGGSGASYIKLTNHQVQQQQQQHLLAGVHHQHHHQPYRHSNICRVAGTSGGGRLLDDSSHYGVTVPLKSSNVDVERFGVNVISDVIDY